MSEGIVICWTRWQSQASDFRLKCSTPEELDKLIRDLLTMKVEGLRWFWLIQILMLWCFWHLPLWLMRFLGNETMHPQLVMLPSILWPKALPGRGLRDIPGLFEGCVWHGCMLPASRWRCGYPFLSASWMMLVMGGITQDRSGWLEFE